MWAHQDFLCESTATASLITSTEVIAKLPNISHAKFAKCAKLCFWGALLT